MSLEEVESQNIKWKNKNNRREMATRLPRIEMRKKTVNGKKSMEKTNTRSPSVLQL